MKPIKHLENIEAYLETYVNNQYSEYELNICRDMDCMGKEEFYVIYRELKEIILQLKRGAINQTGRK